MNLEFGKPFHNKTIDQCRAIGRIGGLRSARNRRLRTLAEAAVSAAPRPEPERETAHQAAMLLDAKLPWLKDASAQPVRRPMA